MNDQMANIPPFSTNVDPNRLASISNLIIHRNQTKKLKFGVFVIVKLTFLLILHVKLITSVIHPKMNLES
jgi:hypothetical protein